MQSMSHHDPDQILVTEHAPVIMVEMEAEDAPRVGTRVSVDYAMVGRYQIVMTWMAEGLDGTWIVTNVLPKRGTSRVSVWLENPGRPELR